MDHNGDHVLVMTNSMDDIKKLRVGVYIKQLSILCKKLSTLVGSVNTKTWFKIAVGLQKGYNPLKYPLAKKFF